MLTVGIGTVGQHQAGTSSELLMGNSGALVEQYQSRDDSISQADSEFVQHIDSLRKAAGIPGLSAAVIKDQVLIYSGGLGFENPGKEIPATSESLYDIASVAKPLSAVVALRLQEERILDLDEPMVNYSEWGEFCVDFSNQPTIFARDLRCELNSHTLRHLLSNTASGTPGTRFLYNPVLYSWASRPMMAAADDQFSSLVDRYVFVPADMRQSARVYRDLPLRKDLAKRLVPGHQIDASGTAIPAPKPRPQGDGAAGGVRSTVLDLAKFDIALDQNVLISVESRAVMMTPVKTVNGETLPYGLGWFIQEYRGHTLVWHSGWWENAYSALYLKIPDLNLTFILLANSEGVWWDNSLERAEVHRSEFAQAFFKAFVED